MVVSTMKADVIPKAGRAGVEREHVKAPMVGEYHTGSFFGNNATAFDQLRFYIVGESDLICAIIITVSSVPIPYLL